MRAAPAVAVAVAVEGRTFITVPVRGNAQPWPTDRDHLHLHIQATDRVRLAVHVSADGGASWSLHGRPHDITGGPQPLHLVMPRNGSAWTHFKVSAEAVHVYTARALVRFSFSSPNPN